MRELFIVVSDDVNCGFPHMKKGAYTPIPHRPRIPRIDTNWQILVSWLSCTQFVKILTDSHSP